MPHMPLTAAHHAKLVAGRRKRAFDNIADALWVAIHHHRDAEVVHLQAQLREIVKRHSERLSQ